jgi:hypothetical protein
MAVEQLAECDGIPDRRRNEIGVRERLHDLLVHIHILAARRSEFRATVDFPSVLRGLVTERDGRKTVCRPSPESSAARVTGVVPVSDNHVGGSESKAHVLPIGPDRRAVAVVIPVSPVAGLT